MQDKKNFLSYKQFKKYVEIIGSLHEVFYREFAVAYLPKFVNAISDYLDNIPWKNIRDYK